MVVLRKNIRFGREPRIVLRNLEETASTAEGSFIMRTGLSWLRILVDLVHFVCLGLRSRSSLAAENLFLRKQLAFYQERKVKPRRADNPTRLTLVLLSRWFNWRDAFIQVCDHVGFPIVTLNINCLPEGVALAANSS